MKYTKSLKYIGVLLSFSIHVHALSLSLVCEDVNRKGLSLLQEGHFAEGETRLAEFLAQLDRSPENALCFGVTLNNLAYALLSLDKRTDAEDAARRSVQSFETAAGTASPFLCRPLLLLVRFSLDRSKMPEAAALLERVESLPLSRHDDLALLNGVRGNLLERSGDRRGGAEAYQQSIEEWEKAGQGSSLNIVSELSNLALLYAKGNHITQALALLERAWLIVDSPSGDSNTRVRLLLAFAATLTKQRDNKKAEDYFRRAIALVDASPPARRQSDWRVVYTGFQAFLKQLGRHREARMIEKQAIALFGPRASSYVVSINSLFDN